MKTVSGYSKFSARSGFGLIEILVASAIMGGLIYTGTTIVQNASVASKRVEGATDFSGLYTSVSQILSRTDVCKDVLRSDGLRNKFPGGVGAKAAVTLFNPSPTTSMIIDPVTGKNPYPQLKVTRFELEKMKLVANSGGKGWTAKIDLEAIRLGTPNVPLRKQFFVNVSIDLVNDTIESCEAGIEKVTIQAAACGGFSANYDQNAPVGADVCSFKSGSVANPSIKFSFGGVPPFAHDVDTGLFSPAQNTVGVTTNGKESLRIAAEEADSAGARGRVLTGHSMGLSAAGNARGPASTDLQSYRENVDEVASGWFSTITGGYKNKASGHYSYVGGGSYQYATGENSVSVGGWSNYAHGTRAAILGGYGNQIEATASQDALIGGGWRNTVTAPWAVVVGGGRNVVNGRFSSIVGGGASDVAGWGLGANRIDALHSFIGGGGGNWIKNPGGSAGAHVLVGGYDNTIDAVGYGFIGGGMQNTVTGNNASAIGGRGLVADGYAQTVVGRYNSIPGSASKTTYVESDLLFIVGNGTIEPVAFALPPVRSNAFTVNGGGDIWSKRHASFGGELSASSGNFGGPLNSSALSTGAINATNLAVGGNIATASLDATGAITANSVTAVTVTQTSDARSKEKVSMLDSMIEKIKQLKPVAYFWKDKRKNGAEKQIGFVAQDVEKVFPELVKTDADGTKSVNYGALVAPLTKTVQEQQIMIEQQQKEIAELRSLVCAIKPDAQACRK